MSPDRVQTMTNCNPEEKNAVINFPMLDLAQVRRRAPNNASA